MSNEITAKTIEAKILTIRNQQVMIDRDLAELYRTETKVLNQAVKKKYRAFSRRLYVCFGQIRKR